MSYGINRNIVECKAVLSADTCAGCTVLIETLWNVKKDFYGYRRKTVAGINRNIVECKDYITAHIKVCKKMY